MTIESIDVIGQVTGEFGKFQLRTILIMFLCKIPTSWFMAIVIYTAPAPPLGTYYCRPPVNLHIDVQDWIKLAHPYTTTMMANGSQKTIDIDYCHVYQDVYRVHKYQQLNDLSSTNIENRTIIPCNDHVFLGEFHSIIAQFNLVCSRQLLLALTQCFHIFGLLIGGIIAYYMIKYISPRHVMLTGMICQILCGNAAGLVRLYELHVCFRCLSAASCALMYTSAQAICQDIVLGNSKKITSIIFELFWSIGLILMPALSIFFTHWSHLYMVISMPTFMLIFLHRYIPDSPRWLVQRGRIHEAKLILIEAGRLNRRAIPENFEYLLQKQSAACLLEPKQSSWMDLWDGYPRKRHLLCVHYAWAIYILLFNSMVLYIRAFGREHLNMNTVAMGFSEVFGVSLGMYLIMYTKRRWLWTGLISIGSGVLAYLTWLIPETMKLTHVVALEMIPSLAIKVATSCSLSILTTCTAELVINEKKKTLMFSVVVWARAWFLWAPFIGSLKVYGTNVPLSVFATLAIIGGILTSVINHSHHKSHIHKRNLDVKSVSDNRNIAYWINSVNRSGLK